MLISWAAGSPKPRRIDLGALDTGSFGQEPLASASDVANHGFPKP